MASSCRIRCRIESFPDQFPLVAPFVVALQVADTSLLASGTAYFLPQWACLPGEAWSPTDCLPARCPTFVPALQVADTSLLASGTAYFLPERAYLPGEAWSPTDCFPARCLPFVPVLYVTDITSSPPPVWHYSYLTRSPAPLPAHRLLHLCIRSSGMHSPFSTSSFSHSQAIPLYHTVSGPHHHTGYSRPAFAYSSACTIPLHAQQLHHKLSLCSP